MSCMVVSGNTPFTRVWDRLTDRPIGLSGSLWSARAHQGQDNFAGMLGCEQAQALELIHLAPASLENAAAQAANQARHLMTERMLGYFTP